MHRQLLILLSFVPFIHSCFTTNRCQCDRVQYIDQAGIQKLEYGSYLANRTTTRPNVTVTDSCQILVDVSKLETDNHYLMVFRDGAPPIFAKRLSDSTDKVIELTDITCVQVGNEFEWQYYRGRVNNLSVAIQSNEEMCGCSAKFKMVFTGGNITADPGLCDLFSVQCLHDNVFSVAGPQYFDVGIMPMINRTAVIQDMTCVSGQWYYNSVALTPYGNCYHPQVSYICGCAAFRQLGFDVIIRYTQGPEGRFANYTRKNGSVVYHESDCMAELKCGDTETLVIFSANYKDLVYPPGTAPVLQCDYSPLKPIWNSPKYWFVDGVMLSDPYYGCYVADQCPCPFAILSDEYVEAYVGTHPSYKNFTSSDFLEIYAETLKRDSDCFNKLFCVYGWPIVFDTETATLFQNKSLDVSCSATTKKWTIEGAQFDQMYAVCHW